MIYCVTDTALAECSTMVKANSMKNVFRQTRASKYLLYKALSNIFNVLFVNFEIKFFKEIVH